MAGSLIIDTCPSAARLGRAGVKTVQGVGLSFVWNLLGDSGGVVNSLDLYPVSLKSLGCFYFRCVSRFGLAVRP